ncbi:hypothetical protein GGX14DRAFT_385659 [Mycena pura]|uniref:Uncharacterized protein n=1 Tax=Mycena pura TaxID=153505 RepID=A0AAD6YQV7_9AGAR|nr:hypothetical protein GGX14DRAFT_385659 [Mycena pura]
MPSDIPLLLTNTRAARTIFLHDLAGSLNAFFAMATTLTPSWSSNNPFSLTAAQARQWGGSQPSHAPSPTPSPHIATPAARDHPYIPSAPPHHPPGQAPPAGHPQGFGPPLPPVFPPHAYPHHAFPPPAGHYHPYGPPHAQQSLPLPQRPQFVNPLPPPPPVLAPPPGGPFPYPYHMAPPPPGIPASVSEFYNPGLGPVPKPFSLTTTGWKDTEKLSPESDNWRTFSTKVENQLGMVH